ncbi:hypothetical protein PUV47_16585 [Pseudovibrio exalbescens]|uniref:hypothetical protein n=1 Tax=Pseudovibrio exalbescens TaxID=197461 RepID=UPI0023654EDF|nr:hypothetical protein [Pseudovibrio exalbescens]MDD7911549.1 hypothetical protein [Pseudovibrio exalbescens]
MKARFSRLFASLLFSGLVSIGQPVNAQTQKISGTISFADQELIPEGSLKLYLKSTARPDSKTELETETPLESRGKTGTLAFVANLPEALEPTAPFQLIARLERADGWLLARGAASLKKPDMPQEITLYTVMY